MNILIKEPDLKVTVSFETTTAPCPGCPYFEPREEKKPAMCSVEGRPLSASVIHDCKRLQWRPK